MRRPSTTPPAGTRAAAGAGAAAAVPAAKWQCDAAMILSTIRMGLCLRSSLFYPYARWRVLELAYVLGAAHRTGMLTMSCPVRQDVDTSGPQSEVVMHVPDRAMGAVIGKGGEVINQLKSVVGVRIRVSGRDEFVEGTRDRTITISGPVAACEIAERLIQQKVAAASS